MTNFLTKLRSLIRFRKEPAEPHWYSTWHSPLKRNPGWDNDDIEAQADYDQD
jgi:hypothetical protein